MYDFGGDDSQTSYGVLTALDAPTEYTMSFIIEIDATGVAQQTLGKMDKTNDNNKGWMCYISSGADKISIQHGDGADFEAGSGDTALVAGTPYHVVITWDGSNVDFYLNGAADGTVALGDAIASNGNSSVTIGAVDDNAAGVEQAPDGRIGQVMWWDVALTTDEALALYAGVIPRGDSLKFWDQCFFDPGIDFISNTGGFKNGTFTVVDDVSPSVPCYLGNPSRLIQSIVPLFKEGNDTLALTDSGLNHIMHVFEGNDTLALQDNAQDESGYQEPDGVITHTETDGTVWTQKYPPFVTKTTWS